MTTESKSMAAPPWATTLLLATISACASSPPMAWGATAHRYDSLLFVCRSVDPSDSRLNLRSQPRGLVKDTISKREVFYVWGRDLHRPQLGYVPVHFQRPLAPATGQHAKGVAGGWVWKAYITCELSN